jgi:TP901 family phage tail tape measure protein
MAKIKNSDLIEDNLLAPSIASAKIMITTLTELETQMKKNLEVSKQFFSEQKKATSSADFKKQAEETKKVAEAEQGLTAIQKEKLKLEETLNKLNSDKIQQNEQLKVLISEQRKKNKELAKDELKLISAYDKKSKKLTELRKKYKHLAVEEKQGTKQAKDLLAEITKLDTQLKKVDETTGQFQRSVGNYGKVFGNAKSMLTSFIGAFGITAGISGFIGVVKSSVRLFADFEKANSNLKAVLGATGEQMEILKKQAQDLGATTSFTASQVTELQTEYAKLGFTVEEITKVTKSTLDASAAMGSNLGEQAALTGATLKAFGLDASEATRVNDVLAASTTKSALDFSKLNAAMSTIAPVAASFGFSVEETTALLGQLSNAGFDASTAATSTRNILLTLADGSSDLAKRLKEPVKDMPSLIKGLKQLTSEGIDLAEALNLTDKRSVAAFSTFLSGTDSLEKLNDALHNAGGTAETMAKTQLDNLSGSVTILNSAWQGFILSLESGDGKLSSLLKTIVQVVTELLSLATGTAKAKKELNESESSIRKIANVIIVLTKFLAIITTAWVSYRVVAVAVNLANKLMAMSFNLATLSVQNLNKALMKNPFGLIAVVLSTLISTVLFFKNSLNETTEATDRLTESKAKLREEMKRLNELQKQAIDRRKIFTDILKSEKKTLEDYTTAQLESAKSYAVTRLVEEERKVQTKERIKDQEILIRLITRLNKELKIREDREIKAAGGTTPTKAKQKQIEQEKDFTSSLLALNSQFYTEQEILLLKSLTDREITEEIYAWRLLELKKKQLNDEIKILDENLKDSANKRLELANLEIDIEKKKTTALLQIEEERQKSQEELRIKERENLVKHIQTSQEIILAFEDEINRRIERRIDLLDQEAQTRKRNIDYQRDLAAQGSQIAAEQLQFEEQKLAEAEERKREQIKREQEVKQLTALINSYWAAFERFLGDKDVKPEQAAMKALQEVGKGIATSKGVGLLAGSFTDANFIDGTENVSESLGNKGKVLPGLVDNYLGITKSGHAIAFDGDERIINPTDNKALGDISNKELVNIGLDYKSGRLGYFTGRISDKKGQDLSLISHKLDSVEKAIKSKPVQRVDVDGLGNMVERVITDTMTTKTTYIKRKGKI